MVILEGWARDGMTDEQIAGNMGISARTLYRWKLQYENALFKRAKGYDVTETKIKTKNGVVIEKTEITKHIPGDTTAQIFWLKNRKPEYWGGGDKFTNEEEAEVHIYVPDNGRDKRSEE